MASLVAVLCNSAARNGGVSLVQRGDAISLPFIIVKNDSVVLHLYCETGVCENRNQYLCIG